MQPNFTIDAKYPVIRRLIAERWLILGMLTLLMSVLAYAAMPEPPRLHAQMLTTIPGEGQIFFEDGKGFSEEASRKFPTIKDGNFHEYVIDLPKRKLNSIRMDPGQGHGLLRLMRLEVHSGGAKHVVFPADSIHPDLRNQVELKLEGRVLEVTATGPDPYLVFWLPKGSTGVRGEDYFTALCLLVLALGFGISTVLYLYRYLTSQSDSVRMAAFGLAGLLLIAASMQIYGFELGMDSVGEALLYGAGLFVAILAFAIVGEAALALVQADGAMDYWGLPAKVLFGQAALILFWYIRSSIGMFGWTVPVTGYELVALILASVLLLIRKGRVYGVIRGGRTSPAGGLCQLAILALLCVVVSGRELPRLVMLSSDPDVHGHFALQIMRMGAVPWSQQSWGPEDFNYPAGTGALLASWSSLSLLDVRNVAATIPFLQYAIGMFAVVDAVGRRWGSSTRLLLWLLGVLLLISGYWLPLRAEFSHGEGYGRIAAFPFVCLLYAMIDASFNKNSSIRLSLCMATAVFTLAVLNPLNLIQAGAIVAFGSFWHLTSGGLKNSLLAAASLLVLPLLILDPYYFDLAFGQSATPGFTLGQQLGDVDRKLALSNALLEITSRPLDYILKSLELVVGADPVQSMLLLSALLVGWSCTRKQPRDTLRMMACAAIFFLMAVPLYAFSEQLTSDRGLYLLHSYSAMGLSQIKLLIGAALSIYLAGFLLNQSRFAAAMLVSVAVAVCSAAVFRDHGAYLSASKKDLCGGLECPSADDLNAVQDFVVYRKGHHDSDSRDAKVLVPNTIVSMGIETWLFPAGMARVAAYMDVGPMAFYYYQGSASYTTDAYNRHVCTRFDREWLLRSGIRYVLLPASESGWCIDKAGMFANPHAVIVSRGGAKIIDINPQ